MDAPIGVVLIFIGLLAVGLVALMTSLFLERVRLKRWLEIVRSANDEDDGNDRTE